MFLRTLTQKSQQTFRKLNQVNIKMIIHHNQVSSFQRTQAHFNIWKSTNVIHHINRPYKKNHMIISIAAKENHSTNSTPISDLKTKWNKHTKNSQQTNEGYLLSKSSASSTLNAEELKVFLSLIGNQRCIFSSLLGNILVMLHTMQEKEIKSTQIEKGGIKWSLFSDNLTVYRGNKKIPTKKKKAFRISTWI